MVKIKVSEIEKSIVAPLQAAGLKEDSLETAVASMLKNYEVVDEDGNAVDFSFKVKKTAPATVASVDMDAIKAAIGAEVKAAFANSPATNHRPSVEVVEPVKMKGVKVYSQLRNITKSTCLNGEDPLDVAYRFGQWALAAMGNQASREYCAKNGLKFISNKPGVGEVKLHQENVNNTGGFLVPEEFDNALIVLREQYGVFRANARVVPMTSDTLTIPRRTGGLTAYPVGEAQAATESTKGWDQVRLTAKDWAVLSRWTNQLNDDAVINVGDDLAGECAYAFAYGEDSCGFIGDGTSAYAGIVGAATKLKNVSGTIANIKGLQVATGTGYATNWDSIVLSDFNKVLGRLPQYAFVQGKAKWYVSQAFWGSVMQKLAMAAGGNRVDNIVNGVPTPMFAGYPVVISQVMPRTSAVSQVACLFGDLGLAAKMGSRRDTSIEFSREASIGGQSLWERNEIGIRAIERFDINVHDIGDTTNAGPLVGLITAAS